jgi:hypothetical protein
MPLETAAVNAVHGSQIENYPLPRLVDMAAAAMIVAYTLVDSLSFAVSNRVSSRRAGKPRSTPDPLLLASV